MPVFNAPAPSPRFPEDRSKFPIREKYGGPQAAEIPIDAYGAGPHEAGSPYSVGRTGTVPVSTDPHEKNPERKGGF